MLGPVLPEESAEQLLDRGGVGEEPLVASVVLRGSAFTLPVTGFHTYIRRKKCLQSCDVLPNARFLGR